MCKLCSKEPEEVQDAKFELRHEIDALQGIKLILEQMRSGAIKPHSDAAERLRPAATHVIKFLVPYI